MEDLIHERKFVATHILFPFSSYFTGCSHSHGSKGGKEKEILQIMPAEKNTINQR